MKNINQDTAERFRELFGYIQENLNEFKEMCRLHMEPHEYEQFKYRCLGHLEPVVMNEHQWMVDKYAYTTLEEIVEQAEEEVAENEAIDEEKAMEDDDEEKGPHSE